MGIGHEQRPRQRRPLLQEQAKAERELDRMFLMSTDLLASLDARGRFLRTNPAFERLLGWTEDDLRERPFIDFIHSDDVAAAQAAMEEISEGPEESCVLQFENRFRNKEGTDYRWISWNFVWARYGELFSAVGRDTTERRAVDAERRRLLQRAELAALRAERSLGEVEAEKHISEFLAHAAERLSQHLRLEQTVQTFVDLVVPDLADVASLWLTDAEGITSRVAIAPRDVFELAKQTNLLTLDSLTPEHPVREVFATGRTLSFDDIGSWTESRGSPEYLAALRRLGVKCGATVPIIARGRTVGVLSVAMTQQDRSLSTELIRVLEAMGRHAALAIENGKLFEEAERSRMQAEQATLAKDQFLATVSHELRTPLSVILGWAKFLRDPSGRALLEKGLEVIERNARVQAQLIEDLLDVSRIIAGSLRIEPAPVFVPTTIETAIESAAPAAAAKGVHLESDVAAETGTIVADPNRLQQIVWNLVANAVKFTPSGGKVRVKAERGDSGLQISVKDTGVGIDPDFLPHVFERFRQSMAGSRAGGLGLGLAIVRHLVEQHGGRVHAHSEGVGKGAEFIVKLPIRAVVPPGTSTRTEAGAPSESETPPPPVVLFGVNVLVVDDEEDARELVSAILMQAGAKVRIAASVDEAIRSLAEQTPDALVSDIGMPVKSGYRLIEYVRRLPRDHGGRMPAIALTAYSRNEDRARALSAGFTSHIPKPVQPTELVLVLAYALGLEVRVVAGV